MASIGNKVAKRYARALFELCEPSQLENARVFLNAFGRAWLELPELRSGLSNPALLKKERVQALRDVVQKIASLAEVNKPDQKHLDSIANFLCLIFENNRLSAAPAIAQVFSALVDEFKKLIALRVVSACPLDEAEKGGFLEQLQKDYGSLASVDWQVDSSILGGLLVKAGDRVLDGSVRGSLDRIRTSLMQ